MRYHDGPPLGSCLADMQTEAGVWPIKKGTVTTTYPQEQLWLICRAWTLADAVCWALFGRPIAAIFELDTSVALLVYVVVRLGNYPSSEREQ